MVVFLLLIASEALAAVPELDPGSASTGLALLLGGLAVFAGRRRKR
jgi:MYXO-CTERM domain-containing protein